MSKPFKPMLAPPDLPDFATLKYPIIASPKLDGIRCVLPQGKALSRSLKPIPNPHLRALLERARMCDGLDGELMIPGATFQQITSAVMGRSVDPDITASITFNVFDHVHDDAKFQIRYARAALQVEQVARAWPALKLVKHTLIRDENELVLYEHEMLAAGYEGIMLRDPNGPYKFGRGTLKEGWLLKVKRFEDAEAVIVGFEQMMVNENEAQTNELGRTKRSSAKAGLVPFPALGAFVLRNVGETRACTKCNGNIVAGSPACGECLNSGKLTFRCGSGLNDDQKAEFWVRRQRMVGATVKYKHQPHGAKDAPRSPVFLGIRAPGDM